MNAPATFYAKDRSSWRTWLRENHDAEQGVWLIYDKLLKGKRSLSMNDICEEAICFGWVDSVPKKHTDTQGMIYVSPRKPKSNWSRLNRSRAEAMTKAGRMHESGKAAVSLAKRTGTAP